MWCLVAGKLLSFVCYFVLAKMILNSYDLSLLDRVLGWFLVEHMFEEYCQTSGKFFFVNNDFRSLTINVVLLLRNLLFFSYFLTLAEFLTFFILVVLCLVPLASVIYRVRNNKAINDTFFTLVLLYFYGCLITLCGLRFYYVFTWFDMLFLLKFGSFGLFFLTVLILFLWRVHSFFFNYKVRPCMKLIFIKAVCYFIIFIILSYDFLIFVTLNEVSSVNNFIQEFVVQVLFLYSYIYYVLKIYINVDYKSSL